jgi:hypothetical protein
VKSQALRRALLVYLALLIPVAWLATKFEPYQMDGDAMAYMDIADLMRSQHWAGVVNAYWHPLYPALLAVAQRVFHTTRMNEVHAYYVLNCVIFLASVGAMLVFVSALDKLRKRMWPSADQNAGAGPLLGVNALRLLGVALLVIAAQRELSVGKIRPDALLQALMLAAFAMLLQALATESLIFAPLMGLFFGLAYLTKSFAFLIALAATAKAGSCGGGGRAGAAGVRGGCGTVHCGAVEAETSLRFWRLRRAELCVVCERHGQDAH